MIYRPGFNTWRGKRMLHFYGRHMSDCAKRKLKWVCALRVKFFRALTCNIAAKTDRSRKAVMANTRQCSRTHLSKYNKRLVTGTTGTRDRIDRDWIRDGKHRIKHSIRTTPFQLLRLALKKLTKFDNEIELSRK